METILISLLTKLGVQLEQYSLVNNHGIIFNSEKYKVDIRHWLNVYGVSTDYWSMEVFEKESKNHVAHHNLPYSMTQEQLVETIKQYT